MELVFKHNYYFPRRQILDSSKQREFANDDFKFDETGRKFSKRVENTVRKGEIARHEQFLLFPQCFQKTSVADTLKPGLVSERDNEIRIPNSRLHNWTIKNHRLSRFLSEGPMQDTFLCVFVTQNDAWF